jgi:DNA repair ATPase RecN
MICWEVPCECNKKPSKPKVPRKLKDKQVETVTTILDPKPDGIRAAMKAAAEVEVEDLDEDFKAAVVVLAQAEMLSKNDLHRYKDVIENFNAVPTRVKQWKERRNELAQ